MFNNTIIMKVASKDNKTQNYSAIGTVVAKFNFVARARGAKMVVNEDRKALYVLNFQFCQSVISAQRNLRNNFNEDASIRPSIRKCYSDFKAMHLYA